MFSTSRKKSKYFLIISLYLGLSIMYQVYIIDFHDGEITGGATQRLFLKVIFLLLFIISLKKYLSWSVFSLNLAYKIPILYVSFTNFILIPFLSSAYLQVLNLFFFLPILFVDWNKPGGTALYRLIWKTIITVVVIQLSLDPIFKIYFLTNWSNNALIGGMGNPNVFGIFLIVSGIASSFLLPFRFKYLSIFLFLSTVLTGSLVSSIVGVGCFFIQIFYFLYSSPIIVLCFMGLIVTPLSIYLSNTGYMTSTLAIDHVLTKLLTLQQLISGDSKAESISISGRLDYLERGLSMIVDSPLSLIFGHPNFIPMYNGDGLWTSYLVTYGLLLTLIFLGVNLSLCYRGILSRSPDLLFSSCIIIVLLFYFIANRILDYWPVGLIYMLAFSYLTTKGVRRIRPNQSQISSEPSGPVGLGMPVKEGC